MLNRWMDLRLKKTIEPARRPCRDPGPLARRVRGRMDELEIGPSQVVQRSSISRTHLQRILTGELTNPKQSLQDALAAALEWDVATLQGRANDVVNAPPATPAPATILMTEPAGMTVYYEQQDSISTHPGRQEFFPPQPPDPRLAGRPVRAARLLDDHLAGLSPAVPAGYTAFYAVLPPDELFLEFGRIYLVNRFDAERKFRPSFLRLRIYPNMYEFAPIWPDAGRNERERITIAKDELASGEIEIAGVFFASACIYF